MKWDDVVFEGQSGEWQWFVSRTQIPDLDRHVVRHHLGCRLLITSFDSSPISPTADEQALGWEPVDQVMLSPPLSDAIEIPCDQFDEWYLLESPSSIDAAGVRQLERFVNYGGWNLASPNEMAASFDPTWDRSGLDWLIPMQQRFWSQLDSVHPVTYVSSGDNDIIVTRQDAFANSIREILSKQA